MKKVICKKILGLILVIVVVATNLTFAKPAASAKKKGILFTSTVDEVNDYGCGQVAFNYTLGMPFILADTVKELHDQGIKVTFIVTSSIKGHRSASGNPSPYNNPVFYMIDAYESKVKAELKEMLNKVGKYVDNYVIGNEISDQAWNYYGPAYVDEYVEAYSRSFKEIYKLIKDKRPSAKLYIPFDQSWDMPALKTDANLMKFKYNTKQMLTLLSSKLSSLEWGVAAHPYPDPLESPVFWDDKYAGKQDNDSVKEPYKAFVVTMNNIEVMCDFLKQDSMKYHGSPRDILISEIGFSDSEGEEVKAAALMYTWTKIKDNPQITGLLYNNVDSGRGFTLSGESEKVFKYMDKDSKNDEYINLMHNIISESAYYSSDGSTNVSTYTNNYSDQSSVNVQSTTAAAASGITLDQEVEKEIADTVKSSNTFNVVSHNEYTDYYTYYDDDGDEKECIIKCKMPVVQGEDENEASYINTLLDNVAQNMVNEEVHNALDNVNHVPSSVTISGSIEKANNSEVVFAFKSSVISFNIVYDRGTSSLDIQ